MARDFNIQGQTLVVVRTIDIDGIPRNQIQNQELGLSVPDGISVTLKFNHKDMKCDDFGPDTPPDIMFNLAEVRVRMLLVHYDYVVAGSCTNESMGGSDDGTLVGAGTIMGGGNDTGTTGNRFVGLYLISVGDLVGIPNFARCWHFPSAFLTEPAPMEIPIGVDKTVLSLNWRCIPYQNIYTVGLSSNPVQTLSKEITSSGALLWDREFPDGFENLENLPSSPA